MATINRQPSRRGRMMCRTSKQPFVRAIVCPGRTPRRNTYHQGIQRQHLFFGVQSNCSDLTDLPGYPGTRSVLGAVDIDPNGNWSLSSFDYLDINRYPYFGMPNWTHSDALALTADNNFCFRCGARAGFSSSIITTASAREMSCGNWPGRRFHYLRR
jgi:hypothetical protein